MKRLFIATHIELNEPFQAWRTRFQHEMRHDDIVWVKEEVRHLTLRFLGATPDSKIDNLKSALAEVCENHFCFQLEINKLGIFGSHYHPEVLWLGFKEFDLFKEVHLDLEPRLQALGFEPYYGNFVPHITLGRVKSVVNKKKFWERFEQSQPDFTQRIPVSGFTLYQSFLHKDGPEYKALASYPLKSSSQ
jgi:2'-5' RNA ligase